MEHTNNINKRREVLKTLSLIAGYSLTVGASSAFLAGCKADTSADWKPSLLNDETLSLIETVTDLILPKTDTPGAKDALVPRYIDTVVKNTYTTEHQDRFNKGLAQFDHLSREKYKKKFVALKPEMQNEILQAMADEWKKDPKSYHIFKEVRDLTISGFANSEVGAKQFFNFDPVPGPYQGCIDYSTVGRTWAL